MAAKAPNIKIFKIPVSKLVIVGIDEEVNDSNAQWYDPASANRVLDSQSRLDRSSDLARASWRQLVADIKRTGGLLQPIVVDIVQTESEEGVKDYKAYVVTGRRRAGVYRQLARELPEFSEIPVTAIADTVDRADATITENTSRFNYTIREQADIAYRRVDVAGVDKAIVAAQLGVSPNHVDKLRRVAKSDPFLLKMIELGPDDGGISAGVGFEFSFLYEQHDLQKEALNVFLAWRDANYCEKRGGQHLQKAKSFCDGLRAYMKAKSDPKGFLEQIGKEISEYLYGPVDEADVPTIDNPPGEARVAGGNDSSSGSPAGGSSDNSAGSSSDGATDDADDPNLTDDGPVIEKVETPTTTSATDSGTLHGFKMSPSTKPSKVRLQQLLEKDKDDECYADWVKPETREALIWIVTGALPEKRTPQNAGLCDVLVSMFPIAARGLRDPKDRS